MSRPCASVWFHDTWPSLTAAPWDNDDVVERKDAWPTNDLSCQDGIVKRSTKICTTSTRLLLQHFSSSQQSHLDLDSDQWSSIQSRWCPQYTSGWMAERDSYNPFVWCSEFIFPDCQLLKFGVTIYLSGSLYWSRRDSKNCNSSKS